MTRFRWYENSDGSNHTCVCEDINATAVIDITNKIITYYNKKNTPLLSEVISQDELEGDLNDLKNKVVNYLCVIHFDFNLEDKEITNKYDYDDLIPYKNFKLPEPIKNTKLTELRDYFAGLAMQSALLTEQCISLSGYDNQNLNNIAEASYKMADAMLKARINNENN